MLSRLGIIVNPMSGRDVRRVAARASNSHHGDKQQLLTRLVLGALEAGVEQILLGDEPFRINRRAVEHLEERHRVEFLQFPLRHTARDSETLAQMMWDAGCRVFIVLGGDGTSRIVSKVIPDAVILPLSTGTNNVFPIFVEASVAGLAAGLTATGRVDPLKHCQRCKQVHVRINEQREDLALVDLAILANDSTGSLLPFAAENLRQLFLARAEPASVGMSPIGGFLMPCSTGDAFGVHVTCNEEPITATLRVGISPGLYDDVRITKVERIELGQVYTVREEGILAFDGDREIEVTRHDKLEISVRMDGPYIIDPRHIIAIAAEHGLLVNTSPKC